MAKFHFLIRATEDITEIWEYTFDNWSERQADKYYRIIIDTCSELAENPYFGKLYSEIAHGLYGYKSGEHVIFYFIIDTNEIEIVRILHGSMNIKGKFN